jgi:hypothetical protein
LLWHPSVEVPEMKVRPLADPDRSTALQAGLDAIVATATVKLNDAGFSTTEVLLAWDEVLNNRWRMQEEDPDEVTPLNGVV